jgi:hypothetical protein
MQTAPALYEQFNFEKSGLPDHPTMRKAFGLMLMSEAEDTPMAYKDARIQRNVQQAKIVAANGWSSDPDVIAAALLRWVYEHAETLQGAFDDVMGARVMELVRETQYFDAHEDDPKRRRWSDGAKPIIYAGCIDALTRWNASLSKSFAEIAERNQGQIVDPQYLGPNDVLNASALFIRQDIAAASFADPAKAAAATETALAGSETVTASIAKQAATLAKKRTYIP